MSQFCILCNKSCDNAISLRTGDHVCQSCIDRQEFLIGEHLSKLSELEKEKPPKNIWDISKFIIIISSILLGLYVSNLLSNIMHDYFFIAFFIIVFIGIYLTGPIEYLSMNKRKPYIYAIREKKEHIKVAMDAIQEELRDIYKEYWDYPPDWEWRREQVINRDKKCRRRGELLSSEEPFHVHHMIPKSLPEGNHSLDNLVLLCEFCHSKEPGHEMISNRRKNIHKTRKRYIHY